MSNLEQVKKDLLFVSFYIKKQDNFIKIVRNIFLKKENIKFFLLEFLETFWYGEMTLFRTFSLLLILIQKNKTIIFDEIIENSLMFSFIKKSFIVAKLTSVVKFDFIEERCIAQQLRAIFRISKIKLASRTDSNLIGGYKVEIGSTLIDKSIRRGLNDISNILGTLKFY